MEYRQSDIEVVYRRGDWRSWSDVERWLERGLSRDQQADNELSEAESRQLLDDVRQLARRGDDLPPDPASAYHALQAVPLRGEMTMGRNLAEMTTGQLRQQAERTGIGNTDQMTKDDLISA